MQNRDTIFALSTILGKSAIAVVRISGPNAFETLDKVTSLKYAEVLPNIVIHANIIDPSTGLAIDEAIIITFRTPKSFTGEDVIELQTHGSIAVINKILQVLSDLGLRPAAPGEFSRRAFLNGKLDLIKAEGLADLIESETDLQRQVALAQLQGSNTTLYEGWRKDILSILASLEALIDFPEDDIPEETLNHLQRKSTDLLTDIEKHLDDSNVGEILQSAFKIAIVGRPNVGKSSLLNFLARREAAIVSDIAGTTRDIIEVKMQINGYPVLLQDTAGIRESVDIIEQIGVNKAKKASSSSQIILVLDDNNDFDSILNEIGLEPTANVVLVHTKKDKLVTDSKNYKALYISCITGEGINELIEQISIVLNYNYSISHAPIITKARYRHHLSQAKNQITEFLNSAYAPLEMQAEMIRLAALEIGRLTGKIDIESILDELFSNFCIGK